METSLKGLFQSLCPQDVTVIIGRVVSDSPLSIQAVNDAKLTLHENLLCLPKHLTDYTVECDIEELGLSGGKIKINNALKTGEIVYLLRFNEKKRYYILDREG